MKKLNKSCGDLKLSNHQKTSDEPYSDDKIWVDYNLMFL